MSALKKIFIVFLGILLIVVLIFTSGRYAWRLVGFDACRNAGIDSVCVGEDEVRISGHCPGLLPDGFCGCCYREENGTLYVGFRFSSVFGFFEPGDFDVTIPVDCEISLVVMKTANEETVIWSADENVAMAQ